jgi:hypothetical protein
MAMYTESQMFNIQRRGIISILIFLAVITACTQTPEPPRWTLTIEAKTVTVLPGRSLELSVAATGRSGLPEERTWRIVSGLGKLTIQNGSSTTLVSPIDTKVSSVTTVAVTIASQPPVTSTIDVQMLAPPSGDIDFGFGETGFLHTDFTRSDALSAFSDEVGSIQVLPNGLFMRQIKSVSTDLRLQGTTLMAL